MTAQSVTPYDRLSTRAARHPILCVVLLQPRWLTGRTPGRKVWRSAGIAVLTPIAERRTYSAVKIKGLRPSCARALASVNMRIGQPHERRSVVHDRMRFGKALS